MKTNLRCFLVSLTAKLSVNNSWQSWWQPTARCPEGMPRPLWTTWLKDSKDEFDKVVVSHAHTYHLRKHGVDIVAVWCNANQFARAEGWHGLFTGMIVSELNETLLYQIETTQEEFDRENVKLAMRLRILLDERIPLSEIPKRMLAVEDVHSPLTTFNYKNFYHI